MSKGRWFIAAAMAVIVLLVLTREQRPAYVPPTDTPRPTLTPQGRLSSTLENEVMDAWLEVEGVEAVENWNIRRDIVYGVLRVGDAFATEATADALAMATRRVLVSMSVELNFVFEREDAVPLDFMWSNLTDRWTVTEMAWMATAQATLTP